MSGKNVAVFGIYPSSLDAEQGAADLISAGYPSRYISVLVGTSTGTTLSAPLDGALGILTGHRALTIPGAAPLRAAGPMLLGLADLGVGGAIGALVGALVGLGLPEYESKRYVVCVTAGGTLLSVHCDTPVRVKRAMQVFNSSGAEGVAASSESRSDRIELAVI